MSFAKPNEHTFSGRCTQCGGDHVLRGARRMDFFKLADNAISEAYPGKPGMWCAQRIPNYGILRGAIVAALQLVERRRTVRPKRAVQHTQSAICAEYSPKKMCAWNRFRLCLPDRACVNVRLRKRQAGAVRIAALINRWPRRCG